MGIYDLELENLSRRRKLAESLQGVRAPTGSSTGRIFAPPQQGEYLATLVQALLGRKVAKDVGKSEKALDERRRADTQKFLRDIAAAQQPDELDTPVLSTAIPIASGDPAEDAARVARVQSGLDTAGEVAQIGEQDQRQRRLAAALRGTELGGVPAMIGTNLLASEFANRAPPEDFTLGAGDVRFSGRTGREVARGAPKTAPEDKLLIDVVDPRSPLGYTTIGRKEWEELGRPPQFHRPAATSTVNLPPEESAESKKVGEHFGTLYGSLQDNARTARTAIGKLDRIEQLSKGLGTGALTPSLATMASYAQSLGITLDPNLDAKQAIIALSNEMALAFRNPAGGEGMPGALSDKDREFLVSITPNLAQTAEGRKLIIETRRTIEQRKLVEAKLAREYRKTHGRLDEGFEDELQAYADANPMFKAVTPQGPSDDDLLSRYSK